MTGVANAVGLHCWDVFRAGICEERCSRRHPLEKGGPVVNQSLFLVNARCEQVPVSDSTAILRDMGGSVIVGSLLKVLQDA